MTPHAPESECHIRAQRVVPDVPEAVAMALFDSQLRRARVRYRSRSLAKR